MFVAFRQMIAYTAVIPCTLLRDPREVKKNRHRLFNTLAIVNNRLAMIYHLLAIVYDRLAMIYHQYKIVYHQYEIVLQ